MICMVDGREFEVEQTAGGWCARERGFVWGEARSVAFALIKADGGRTTDPERFGREAHAHEGAVRRVAS